MDFDTSAPELVLMKRRVTSQATLLVIRASVLFVVAITVPACRGGTDQSGTAASSQSAAPALSSSTCGTVAECAQAAAMSAKTATDAELFMGAKIDELAKQVQTLQAKLANNEAALDRIRTSGADEMGEARARGSDDGLITCPHGQYVAGLKVAFANPGHGDSALANLQLVCRDAAPSK